MDETGAILDAAAGGRVAPGVALMRLAMGPEPEALLLARLAEAAAAATGAAADRLGAVLALWRERPGAVARLRAVLSRADHSAGPAGTWATVFDALAADDPDAAVALYALGDAGLLAAATDEIVRWLAAQGLARAGATVVDAGCGIGRVAAALAPRVGRIVATEVSAGMLSVARDRLRGAANVLPVLAGPDGLRCLAPGSADLLLAVDVAPYWHQAGLLPGQLVEAARILRRGGAAVLMNVSYRGDDAADGRELGALGASCGLAVPPAPLRPFATWDGAVWRLDKA